ncbi:MAG: hypothetical protein CMJ58_00035 [Planctomycetaceae bacterium]|nr:hypothetical protein [Planctomycetaceae bacterium]
MLRLTSPTGAEISASDRITIDPVTELSFRHLFSNPAEVRISLGVALIDILAAPEVGPGAPGAQDFGVYRRTFDLETLNAQLDGATALQALTKQDLVFALKATGDPVVFLDDLVVVGAPAAKRVPEPSSVALAALSLVAAAGVFAVRCGGSCRTRRSFRV